MTNFPATIIILKILVNLLFIPHVGQYTHIEMLLQHIAKMNHK